MTETIREVFEEIVPLCRKQLYTFDQIQNDPDFTNIKIMFSRTLSDLLQRKDWPDLRRDLQVNQNILIANYDDKGNILPEQDESRSGWSEYRLPEPFRRLARDTGLYNDANYTKAINIPDGAEWHDVAEYGYNWFDKFRLFRVDKKIQIQPPIFETLHDTRTLYYVSNEWLFKPGDNPVFADKFGIDPNWQIRLPFELLVDGTVGRYMRYQGWDQEASQALENYEEKIDSYFKDDQPEESIMVGQDGILRSEWQRGSTKKVALPYSYNRFIRD